MKLTTFTDYSLRLLLYLAVRPQRRATIAEIATAFDISENHMVKVAHFLGKCGCLSTVRGKGGGLELASPPERLGLGWVIRQTEASAALAECFDQSDCRCVIAPCCRLRGVLAEALAAFYAVLDRHTLADLVANREELALVLLVDRSREAAAGQACA